MAYRTISNNTLDPVDNIGYKTGIITRVYNETDTADVDCNGEILRSVPVFYNCPSAGSVQRNGSLKNSSDAFSRGDEVAVRIYKEKAFHIIGFTGELWPCIKTPAYVFYGIPDDHILKEKLEKIEQSQFYDRYKKLTLSSCATTIATYINTPNVDISTGFVSIQQHWTDSIWHRDTKMYFNGEFIYGTLNNETSSHVFNGTRSNILGLYKHPITGWGCMIYQVNTFYDWKPRVSGRVKFDFFIYTSSGIHTKLATAEANITETNSQAYGEVVTAPAFYSTSDDYLGGMLFGGIKMAKAGIYSSDGSTNDIGHGDYESKLFVQVMEGTEEPYNKLFSLPTNTAGRVESPDGVEFFDNFLIYVKNR